MRRIILHIYIYSYLKASNNFFDKCVLFWDVRMRQKIEVHRCCMTFSTVLDTIHKDQLRTVQYGFPVALSSPVLGNEYIIHTLEYCCITIGFYLNTYYYVFKQCIYNAITCSIHHTCVLCILFRGLGK